MRADRGIRAAPGRKLKLPALEHAEHDRAVCEHDAAGHREVPVADAFLGERVMTSEDGSAGLLEARNESNWSGLGDFRWQLSHLAPSRVRNAGGEVRGSRRFYPDPIVESPTQSKAPSKARGES